MKSYIRLLLGVILSLNFILFVHGQPQSYSIIQSATWSLSEGGNGHFYSLYSSFYPVSALEAHSHCTQLNNRSYLATINSYREWDWIEPKLLAIGSNSAWISGRDTGLTGNWVYSSGPEMNEPLFHTYTGQCFGFSLFEHDEPSYMPNEEFIYVRGTWNYNNAANNNTNDEVSRFICEEYPLINSYNNINSSEIHVSSIGTNGGQVSIKFLTHIGQILDVKNLNVTFIQVDTSVSTSCTVNSIDQTSNSLFCTIPPIHGFQNVLIRDLKSGHQYIHYGWQPYPPFVKAVYPPPLNQPGLVTIIGENFAKDETSVSVSGSQTCQVIVSSSNQIICKLIDPLNEKLLPIIVTASNVRSRSYNLYIYCNGQFYFQNIIDGQYDQTKNVMKEKVKIGITNSPPSLGVIDNASLYNCLNQSLLQSHLFEYWIGATQSNNDPLSFVFNDGPVNGSPTSIYYSSLSPQYVTINSSTQHLLYRFPDRQLRIIQDDLYNQTATLYTTPLITFYQQQQQPIIISNSTYIQEWSSGLITITGNHFGKDSSYILISVQGIQCLNPTFTTLALDTLTCWLNHTNNNRVIEPNLLLSNGTTFDVTIQIGKLLTSKIFDKPNLKECPNNCSNHGACNRNFGSCLCDQGYESTIDCSVLVNPEQMFKIEMVGDKGLSKLSAPSDSNNQNGNSSTVNFTTGIQFIREIGIDNEIIKVISMNDVKWTIQNTPYSSGREEGEGNIFIGKIGNESRTIITVKAYQYQNSSSINFAGEDIQLAPNSIKYHINISNWNWQSSINTLEIIFLSQSDGVSYDKCGRKQVKIIQPTSNSDSNSVEDDQQPQVTWTKVQVGRSLLNCKLASRIIIDNYRNQPSRTSILDQSDGLYQQINISTGEVTTESMGSEHFNVLTVLHAPHFSQSIELDPALNALLVGSEDTVNLGDESECNSGTLSFEKWKIITIAICGFFGLFSLTVALILATKKKIKLKFTKKLNGQFTKLNRTITQFVLAPSKSKVAETTVATSPTTH